MTLAQLADYSNVSREGKLNILGIFNRILTQRMPAQHPSMQLVLQFQPAVPDVDREHDIEINCMGPDGGEPIFELKGSFIIQRDATSPVPAAVNQVIDIKNLTFKEFGGHTFSIFVDNDLKSTIGLEIVRIEPQTPQLPGA